MKNLWALKNVSGLLLTLILFIGCNISDQPAAPENTASAPTNPFFQKSGNCVTPPAGLVGWWPGDGDALDIVGGNNGTLQNGATFAQGMVEQAFSFDGVDDYVEVGNDARLALTSTVTIDAWIKTSATIGGAILYKHGASGDRSYGLQIRDPDVKADFFVVSGGITRNHLGTTNVNDGEWHHIAGVFDGLASRHELYIDGVLENGTTPSYNSIDQSTAPLWIGAGAGDNSSVPNVAFFDGLIDEVEIFNRALSASEIQAIYNAGRAGKCKKITICHKPGTPAQETLVIPIQALAGHLGHGDTIGPCE